MMQPSVTQCPAGETMAAWVEGRLSQDEIAALIEHASSCPHCVRSIDAANEAFHEEAAKKESGWRKWLLAAAAILLIALPALFVVRSRREDPLRDLVEVAPRSARSVEARLTGGFAHAPYRGTPRASDAADDREQMKMIGVAAETLDRAERDRSGRAQRAAAVAMVLIDRAGEAIPRLAAEAERSPSDATAWSDLAAAQYAAALSGRASLYPEALASCNRALQIDARLPEALFNRALILERMGLHTEARSAWELYLEVDATSPWAGEARDHLARLAAERESPFESERTQLEQAGSAGDAQTVDALVSRHRQQARASAEVEYLGRWAEAWNAKDTADAQRWLAISRSIGVALARDSGESLLRDAVTTIDAADAVRRKRIAAAHVVYRRGRLSFHRKDLGAAERDLRAAAAEFASAGDPMALVARSYAAGARLAQNDSLTARRELEALVIEVDAARAYFSLAGQARWELGRALTWDGDATGAARVYAEAQSSFRRAGEAVNEAMVGTMLADVLTVAGRPDEAWRVHIAAFEALSDAGRIELLDAAVGGAALTALRAGRREAARALVDVNESLERGMSNDLLLADTLVRKSLLHAPSDAASADAAAATRWAREAGSVAARISDAALRARHVADAELAMAVAVSGAEPERARDLATRVLDVYARIGLNALVAEPYLVRARASLRLGDVVEAERDLAAGMFAVEQHPMSVGGAVIGTGVLDAGNALFEEAIRLELDRGMVAAAMANAERMRGFTANAGTIDDLRRRIDGSGAAVLAIAVLPHEVVAFAVTGRDVIAARRAIPRENVAALASSGGDASLYDLLIRPAGRALSDARRLIIVPDALLENVSFAALRDEASGRVLVERMPVAIARSAVALQSPARRTRPGSVAAMGLSAGPSLVEVDGELAEIGRLYRSAQRIDAVEESARAADVLHIAGHTDVDAGGDAALATAGAPVTWRAIASMDEVPAVVVLSACNTLRGPRARDRRALSLAGAFAAAGARDVIGTLAPIGDADARSLFLAVHERLARGIAAPEALRQVQLAELRRPGSAWRKLAVLTTTIHSDE